MPSLSYVQPGLLLVLVSLGAALLRRKRWLTVAGTIALALWCSQPVAALVIATLERRYPVRPFPEGEAQAIVVLSGGIYKQDAGRPEHLPAEDTYVRGKYAAWLYRNWRALPVVASGGLVGTKIRVSGGEVLSHVLEESGVPRSMIWVENRSQSTYENALYTAELLRSRGIHRIALVTEAYHMLRSDRAFQRVGLLVSPAPCAYRYLEFEGGPMQFVPSPKAILWNELALHEWVGLLWYRITRRI